MAPLQRRSPLAPDAVVVLRANLLVGARWVVYDLPSGKPLRAGVNVHDAVRLGVTSADEGVPAADQVGEPATGLGYLVVA